MARDDFFGTALGEKEGRYEGFQLAVPHVQIDEQLLLVEPGAARLYRDSLAPAPVVQDTALTQPELGGLKPAAQSASRSGVNPDVYGTATAPAPAAGGIPKMKSFHGAVEVDAARAKARLMQIAEEVINVLTSDPLAKVTVNLELSAEFSNGAA